MRKLVMVSFIIIVMLTTSCESGITNSKIDFETSSLIYANNVTVTLEQDLVFVENEVAPIPHLATQYLTSKTIEDINADIPITTSDDKYRVSLTANELKKRLKIGGSMASHVTIDVTGVRNNSKKATFTVIVNEKSGYKFDNGVTDRFNIISAINKTKTWIEEIDMSKYTFAIEANRHIASGAYNLTFPDTETIIFRNGAIETKTITLINTSPNPTSITKNKLSEVTKNAITEEINKTPSLNGKILVTAVVVETITPKTDPITTLEVEITIKSADTTLYILTDFVGGVSKGTVTIKVPSGFTITD